MINIAVMNRSTVVDDDEGHAVAHSVHKQIREDYAKAWGTSAHIDYYPKDKEPPTGHWQVVVLDNSDEANALGYHDLTVSQRPLGKVFAGTDKQVGALWSVTLSHEVLEMLGDPDINDLSPDNRGRIFAKENCDAVEADDLGYDLDGQRVSNFVYPAWFSPSAEGQQQIGLAQQGVTFDHKGLLGSPFELAPGGYISYTDTWPPNWQQEFFQDAARITGDLDPLTIQETMLARPRVGSRRERRRTDRRLWRLSTAS